MCITYTAAGSPPCPPYKKYTKQKKLMAEDTKNPHTWKENPSPLTGMTVTVVVLYLSTRTMVEKKRPEVTKWAPTGYK